MTLYILKAEFLIIESICLTIAVKKTYPELTLINYIRLNSVQRFVI